MTERNNSFLRSWTVIVLTILAAFFLWYVRALIVPLIYAALIAYVLNPLVDYVTKYTRLSRSLSILIVFIIGLGLIIAIPGMTIPILVDEVQTLSSDFENILLDLQAFLAQPIVFLRWEINLRGLIPDPISLLSGQVTALSGNILHIIGSTTENFIWSLVIIVTTIYLLKDYSKLRDWMLSLVSEPYQPIVERIYCEIKGIWNAYLRGNLALMTIVGIVFSIVWLAIGLPGGLILGIIAGILTIIPDLGPAIAAILAMLVALVEGSNYLPISNFWFALLVLGIYLILVNIKTIWLRPRIYGHSVHMHEGLVFIVVMGAVVLEGILGALIVVPLLATAGIILRYLYKSLLGHPLWTDEADENQSENPT